MHQFAGQTPDDKIKFLFKVYDIDGKILILQNIVLHSQGLWDEGKFLKLTFFVLFDLTQVDFSNNVSYCRIVLPRDRLLETFLTRGGKKASAGLP